MLHPSFKVLHSQRPANWVSKYFCHLWALRQTWMVLLNEQEWDDYEMGQTVFSLNNNIVQIQVEKYRTPLFSLSKQAATDRGTRRPAVRHLTDKDQR